MMQASMCPFIKSSMQLNGESYHQCIVQKQEDGLDGKSMKSVPLSLCASETCLSTKISHQINKRMFNLDCIASRNNKHLFISILTKNISTNILNLQNNLSNERIIIIQMKEKEHTNENGLPVKE